MFNQPKNLKRLNILVNNVKPYQKEVVFLSLLSLFSALFHAFTPYLAGQIIDGLIKPRNQYFGYFLPLAPAFFFFWIWFVAQLFTNITDWYLDLKQRIMEEKIFADYLVNALSRLLELPMTFHKTTKFGEVNNRLHNAANSLSTILNNVAITLLPQFLSIIVALVVTFLVNPILSLLLVLSVIIYLFILFKTGPEYTRLIQKMRRAYNKAFGEAHDALMNVQSVKQAVAESFERKRLYKNFHLRAVKYWRDMIRVWQMMSSSQRVLVASTQALIYLLSIYFITKGAMTVGELAMFNGYVALFLGPFTILTNNWDMVQNGLVNLERADKILSLDTEPYDHKHALILKDFKGKVEFQNISFSYGKKHKKVLHGVSFAVEPGEVIALVGESGVGKTTIVDLISRFFHPQRGRILVDGHNVKDIDLKFLRGKIATVPQEILLFHDTILNNIRYGSFNAEDDDVQRAAKIAHADQFIEEFPKKYKQVVGQRGIKLSMGQKQRVAIARAVLRDPKILILDEPTSALDARSEKLVEDALRALMKERTTFIIAHRLSTVRHADKILVLEKGRIVEIGSHDELIKREGGAYRKLYQLQIGLKA